MALYLGIAVLGVIAVACTESSVIEGADADISDVDAPAPLIVSPGAGAINGTGANPSGLVGPVPSDVPLNGQAINYRAAIAESLSGYGGTVLAPAYIPPGFELKDARVVRSGRTETFLLRYEIPDEFVWFEITGWQADKFTLESSPESAGRPIQITTQRRGISGPDTSVVEFSDVLGGGFNSQFTIDDSVITVYGQAHRCIGDCFSWCTDLDCPKFSQPLVEAIVNSISPID
ncbi:MAG: hypothetical protein IIB27_05265 [Chloroflexi bacterium]|nr:hypothetical protein [Chloroflexota bacterium]